MLPMDLASARGTKIRGIVIDHRPSTGRGKRLTLAQENVLRRLYEQEISSLSMNEQPVKKFWVNLASRFREHSGREYSWLSVKRRAESWRQKSPERGRQLETSSADVNNGGLSTEAGSEAVGRHSPRLHPSHERSQLVCSRDSGVSQRPDDNFPRGSSASQIQNVGDWAERNWSSGVDPNTHTGKSSDSPCMSYTRSRSMSPRRVSQPGYRHRSPSTRRTEFVSRRLHRHLDSASNEKAMSHHNSPCDVSDNGSVDQRSSVSNHVPQSVETQGPDCLRYDSSSSSSRHRQASHDLRESPQLSEPDDLPLAPTRILRRVVAREKTTPKTD